MHGTQISIIPINGGVLAHGDNPINDCSGLLHESLSIIADQRMNAGLDMIGLPGSTDFGLLEQVQSRYRFATSSLTHLLRPPKIFAQQVALTARNEDEALFQEVRDTTCTLVLRNARPRHSISRARRSP
ncbi:hypothetical protein FQZ97_1098080 [compost metagenome]